MQLVITLHGQIEEQHEMASDKHEPLEVAFLNSPQSYLALRQQLVKVKNIAIVIGLFLVDGRRLPVRWRSQGFPEHPFRWLLPRPIDLCFLCLNRMQGHSILDVGRIEGEPPLEVRLLGGYLPDVLAHLVNACLSELVVVLDLDFADCWRRG